MLALLMGLPMLSLAGVPALNGYVSKTLLHESIVEYIPGGGIRSAVLRLEGCSVFSAG